jgi:hypothetical protein
MDELYVYGRQLSAIEVKSLYDRGLSVATFNFYGFTAENNESNITQVSTQDLLAYFPFDETNGTSYAMDVSGNKRYTTMYGFESNQSIWEGGKIGNAIRFDGVDDYMTLPTTISSTYTISMWLKTTSEAGDSNSANWNSQACLLAGPTNSQAIFLYNGKFGIWSGTSGSLRMTSMSTINHGSWMHLVASRNIHHTHNNQGAFKMYLNGSLDKSTNSSHTANSTGALLHIGRTQGGSTHFQGLMDELYVYGRQLSAIEVQNLYNLGQ